MRSAHGHNASAASTWSYPQGMPCGNRPIRRTRIRRMIVTGLLPASATHPARAASTVLQERLQPRRVATGSTDIPAEADPTIAAEAAPAVVAVRIGGNRRFCPRPRRRATMARLPFRCPTRSEPMSDTPKIIYTLTDEAPFLATASLLPIVQAFAGAAGIAVETRDISLSGRILAQFPELLGERAVADDLAELGALARTPEANIIKLPNISASVPQLKAAIKELQAQGHPFPDYPDEPKDDGERDIRARYGKAMGSAVNPVLREGNSDRRAPRPVKEYARKHPQRMGKRSADSKSHVAHMDEGDFYGSEQSATMAAAGSLRIEFAGSDGSTRALRDPVKVQAGEIVDAAHMSRRALAAFIAREIEDARAQGVLFSLHLKATMMKVSDPIMFGVAVSEFYRPVLEKHADALAKAGFSPDNGIGDLYARLDALSGEVRD